VSPENPIRTGTRDILSHRASGPLDAVLEGELDKLFPGSGKGASGKTTIIATTEGNISVPDRDEKVGLNVYRKKRKK